MVEEYLEKSESAVPSNTDVLKMIENKLPGHLDKNGEFLKLPDNPDFGVQQEILNKLNFISGFALIKMLDGEPIDEFLTVTLSRVRELYPKQSSFLQDEVMKLKNQSTETGLDVFPDKFISTFFPQEINNSDSEQENIVREVA